MSELTKLRYKHIPDGALYMVVDTTIDSTICYCYSSEYADMIVGAMNYQRMLEEVLGESEVALRSMDVAI